MLDLIRIDDFARAVHRRPRTVRWWAERGFAPDGTRLRVHRDAATKIRYFEAAQVERVRAALIVAPRA